MVEPNKVRIVTAFAVMLVIGMVLIALFGWALKRFAGVSIGSGGVGIVPPMVAAIVAGQRHAMAVQALPRSGYAWSVAARFVAVVCAFSVVGLGALYLTDPAGVAEGFGTVGALVSGVEVAAAVVGLLLLLWGILRWAYAFGAKTQLKAQARIKP